MKVIEFIRLGECAICPYSTKKKDKQLRCHWSDSKPATRCGKIRKCGNFLEGKVDISNLKVE